MYMYTHVAPTEGKRKRETERQRETRASTRLYSRSLLLTWSACRSIRTCDYQADPYCVFATEMERHSLRPAIVYAYVFRKSPARCPMSRKFCANYFNHCTHRAFLIIGPGSGLSGIVKKIQPDPNSSFLTRDSMINLGSIFPGGEGVKILSHAGNAKILVKGKSISARWICTAAHAVTFDYWAWL